MAAQGFRPDRVGQLIQERLSGLLLRGLKDPRIGLVTITGVKVSPDLREARVFWTVHGDANVRKQTGNGLEAAKGWLKREVGKDLGLRVTPNLSFKYDEAIDRGERIEALLREVGEDERKRVAEQRGDEPAGGGGGTPGGE